MADQDTPVPGSKQGVRAADISEWRDDGASKRTVLRVEGQDNGNLTFDQSRDKAKKEFLSGLEKGDLGDGSDPSQFLMSETPGSGELIDEPGDKKPKPAKDAGKKDKGEDTPTGDDDDEDIDLDDDEDAETVDDEDEDDDLDLEDEDEDDDKDPKGDGKEDAEKKKRLDDVRRADERKRQQFERERATFERERATFASERATFEKETAEMRTKITAFEAVIPRINFDPASVLRAMGVDSSKFANIARQIYAHSPDAASDPKYKDAAQRAIKDAELEAEINTVKSAYEERLRAMEERLETQDQTRQVEDFLGKVQKAAAKAADKLPLTAEIVKNNPKRAKRDLAATALALAKQNNGELPSRADVLKAHEKKLRRELRDIGIAAPAKGKKPAGDPTKAGAAGSSGSSSSRAGARAAGSSGAGGEERGGGQAGEARGAKWSPPSRNEMVRDLYDIDRQLAAE